jgi:hypothetical protein
MTATSRSLGLLVCVLASLSIAPAAGAIVGATGQKVAPQTGPDQGSAPVAAATLEQCVTAVLQSERSATFSGEMAEVPHSARMAMQIDVQERVPGEALFHTINAPGLGVWHEADAGVKTYKDLRQVTNLSSPAFYRAAVHFRWLNAEGRPIRHAERRTTNCVQPAAPPIPQSA